MQRIRLKYGKELKYIGHLDMVRLWERAIRRTDIPIAYTEGFNPRQMLSFGPPLSLGLTSECELLDIYLDIWTNPDIIKEELNKTLPDGIHIIESKNIYSDLAAITAAITTAKYAADFEGDIKPRLDDILSLKEIFMARKEKKVNIRPMIRDLAISYNKLIITAQCDNYGALKGLEIIELFSENNLANIRRIAIY